MYDELVKRMRNCTSDTVEDCAGCPYIRGYNGTYCMNGLVTEAADAIEALSVVVRAQKAVLDKFPRWIPVTERLPSENGFYLCLYNHNHPGGVAMDEGLSILQWFCGKWNLNEIYTVTHWMPIPEPPKEET